MAARFTWTQLMTWEREAVRRRVPLEISGLVTRAELPNNRSILGPTVTYERNGEKTLLTHRARARWGMWLLFFLGGYQVNRLMKVGWDNEQEHHNFEFDNIVYDKLSCRQVPYHESVFGYP
ncbi:unnamed protein product [Blepharisma stoltei]|uniref:Uncharacterized protein n=1 Tax=Blepharisma stoltei TaxID=1481888 RepID=A0AAU9IJT4_9CILI|nr:unnamed protein product [Blepharisma stoltei]